MLADADVDRDRLARAAADEFVASTDIADLLVRSGVPFRESHGIVAGVHNGSPEETRKRIAKGYPVVPISPDPRP